MIEKNVALLPPRRLSMWRKVALGSWASATEAQVYCELRLDCGPVLKRIKDFNQTSKNKITLTHVMGLAMGKILREYPDLNCVIRFGQIYPRQDVDIFFHVVHDETELSGHVVRKIDTKSIEQIAADLTPTAKNIKSGNDPAFKKIKDSWKFIPSLASKHVLNFIGFLSYSLNINIKGLGIPKDSFGSVWITNIGSLGFSQAYVPLVNYTRTPFICALGKPEMRAHCLEDGTIVARQELGLYFTFDHRLMDGARGAKMGKLLEKIFANPELLEL